MNTQAEADSSDAGRSRSRSDEIRRSDDTLRRPRQAPPQIPMLSTPSSDLYTPQMNDNGTPGYNPERYGTGPSDIGIARSSPSRDVIPPGISQPRASSRRAMSQPALPDTDPTTLSSAIQAAINKAVESAVNKAMKIIQEDTIKIMQDYAEKKAKVENDKATEFRKWFDNRLARMDNRIQRDEGIVDDAEDRQDRESARERFEDEIQAASTPVEGESPPGRKEDAAGLSAPSRKGESQAKKLTKKVSTFFREKVLGKDT